MSEAEFKPRFFLISNIMLFPLHNDSSLYKKELISRESLKILREGANQRIPIPERELGDQIKEYKWMGEREEHLFL